MSKPCHSTAVLSYIISSPVDWTG